ncbi:hypothetical protein K9U34_02215 [Lawsonia intracellularis]|uniref:NA n=1 Tax=Lawsonia intracellularis (strain PHE/MN1-00) TaxID=363253 RepID=Q1MS31_LAWIP|nr:hypothetical protein [Lawsonia intracellularis]AGC49538.1 hypothetical protein LAW_00137 [Lawsonia intracellularis N343]KAA0205059.1 hypothetical protein C4K43_00935 [Lawsonia intracellularis]MBZ3892415.1 hypothetical protein [Lawsonia intracellularis]RBN32392.1 hypothetical protein DR194_05440 [Lawsonia intracellularis]RBN33959.1 hypothetical protein DR192_05455 [Lawsonia intracellularis]
MKVHAVIIRSGILSINLFTIPLAVAHNFSDQFVVETSITQSIKDGYTNLKSNVEETMSSLTDEKNTDAEKYLEQHDKDLKAYQNEIKKADQNYMKARKEAQRNYMKNHSQLPMEEDIEKDMEHIKSGL